MQLRARSAFTLIELLVVIGIIAVLMGIAIAVGSKVQDSGKVKSTKDLILALDGIQASSMTANSGQIMPPQVAEPRLYTNRTDPAAATWVPVADARSQSNGEMINSVGLFLWQARQYPEAAKLIESLPSKLMKILELDTPGEKTPLATAVDAWGNPIRYVHPAYDGLLQGAAGTPDAYVDLTANPPFPQPPNGAILPAFSSARRNAIKRGDPATDPSLAADSDGGQCPAGRPYFYSAGPDGDPSTIDDNIYSVQPVLPKKSN